MAHEILLETGTNEVEILEFFLDDQSFGVNVAKIMQIADFEEGKFTPLPDQGEANMGVILWHDRTIPLINLNKVLKRQQRQQSERPIVLITRFNDTTNGFFISGVNRIHRLGWDDISPSNSLIENHSSNFTGSVNIDGREILLVDFEYLIAELFPETKMSHDLEHSNVHKGLERGDCKLVFAEDSVFIRKSVVKLLSQVGYSQVDAFENGQDAYNYLARLVKQAKSEGRDISDYVNLVLTDIEMPKMDGLTFCRRLKQDLGMSKTKVAIFSSLIDTQMIEKCKDVGADAYTTKPKISELVELIDGLLHV